MNELFGTDGMRGHAGEFPLDELTIEKVGRSLTRHYSESLGRAPKFITGRDTRESGTWIEEAIHRGVIAEGGSCESAGVMTTPGVAFLTREFEFDAGIVISASHNPYLDNGIKVFSPSGKKISSEIERRIEGDIGNINPEGLTAEILVDESHSAFYFQRYLDYLESGFPTLSLADLRIVVDSANGAAFQLAPQLLKRLGAEVVSIYDEPDGKNINENCGSLHLDQLRERVLAERADLGIALDGDAGRALFIDEKGNIVDGDAVLWIMARLLSDHGKLHNQTVVATVMSNLGLEVALNSRNIKLVRTAVGDKYVLEELLRTNSVVGGEQSGHIIFPQKSLVGDGIMTALFVLEAIWENAKSLSEITSGFTRFPQILINVKVREKRPFDEVSEISDAARSVEQRLGASGRLLLRYSGTENLARVMIEGENQSDIDLHARELADVIRAALG
ncbi:MAG: phosphoglucosamine mutase [Acidobacteria bacterium]|nr:phosphoglucosamine mutase [Acidobacteriota bacterium]